MAKISGVGGVCFKSNSDNGALAAWYRKHLGMRLEDFGGAILTFRTATWTAGAVV
jgi:hypothetical protein